MIEIKSHFGDWKEVDFDTAKRYVVWALYQTTTQSTFEGKKKLIAKRLRGIDIEELLKEEER